MVRAAFIAGPISDSMGGRPVPPHGSGGQVVDWSDETAGRALYRAAAERDAREQLAYGRRRVRLNTSAAMANVLLEGV